MTRLTLNDVEAMTATELANLDGDELHLLKTDAQALVKKAEQIYQHLNTALNVKYQLRARA